MRYFITITVQFSIEPATDYPDSLLSIIMEQSDGSEKFKNLAPPSRLRLVGRPNDQIGVVEVAVRRKSAIDDVRIIKPV